MCAYTLQRVSGETELADDVSGDVCLDALTDFCMTFCNFKPLVKLFRVKLLADNTNINTVFVKNGISYSIQIKPIQFFSFNTNVITFLFDTELVSHHFTRHSRSLAGLEIMMRIFFTSLAITVTSSLSERSYA